MVFIEEIKKISASDMDHSVRTMDYRTYINTPLQVLIHENQNMKDYFPLRKNFLHVEKVLVCLPLIGGGKLLEMPWLLFTFITIVLQQNFEFIHLSHRQVLVSNRRPILKILLEKEKIQNVSLAFLLVIHIAKPSTAYIIVYQKKKKYMSF